jgi:hypothetical protein
MRCLRLTKSSSPSCSEIGLLVVSNKFIEYKFNPIKLDSGFGARFRKSVKSIVLTNVDRSLHITRFKVSEISRIQGPLLNTAYRICLKELCNGDLENLTEKIVVDSDPTFNGKIQKKMF